MGALIDFYKEYHDDALDYDELPPVYKDKYEIIACIKHTKMKQVYLIQSKVDSKKCILKKVSSTSNEDLEEEYIMHRSLFHPGLISAIEFIKEDQYNYLIREYIEGNTITELVEMTKSGNLPDDEIIKITRQLCQITGYLHSQNPPVIHRDIKPDNIIVTREGVCKIIDFGISRRFQGEHEKDTVIMGTQYLAPPEQYGFQQTDARSDIYSIGILMYFMATGSFDIREKKDYIISKRICKCIQKSTEFSPKDRYQNVKQLEVKLAKDDSKEKGRLRIVGSLGGIAIISIISCVILHYESVQVTSQQNQMELYNKTKVSNGTNTWKESDSVSYKSSRRELVTNVLYATSDIDKIDAINALLGEIDSELASNYLSGVSYEGVAANIVCINGYNDCFTEQLSNIPEGCIYRFDKLYKEGGDINSNIVAQAFADIVETIVDINASFRSNRRKLISNVLYATSDTNEIDAINTLLGAIDSELGSNYLSGISYEGETAKIAYIKDYNNCFTEQVANIPEGCLYLFDNWHKKRGDIKENEVAQAYADIVEIVVNINASDN